MSPEPVRALPRRAAFAVSGTAVLAAAAACSSGGTATGTTAPTSPTGSSPATPSGGTASAAVSSATAPSVDGTPAPSAPAGTSEPAPAGTPLASVADVESAGSVVVESADGPLLLAFADGTVVAHTAVCTHQQCTIAASGMCPCHQSAFDVITGAVEQGPALRPLAQENVTVSGGQVYRA